MLGTVEFRRPKTNIIYPPSAISVVKLRSRHVATRCHDKIAQCINNIVTLVRAILSTWYLILSSANAKHSVELGAICTADKNIQQKYHHHTRRMTFFICDFRFKFKHIFIRSLVSQINYSALKVPDCMQPHYYHFSVQCLSIL